LRLDVDATTVDGRWFRHVPPDADPLGRGSPPGDNRWQRGHVVDAHHLVSDPDGAWAEWYRHLAERGLPPAAALPRDLWTYTLTSLEVADLRTTGQLARVSLSLPSPGRRDWPPFQAVGERLHSDGRAGLLAPSAARPTSLVLCLFLPVPAGTVRPETRTHALTAPTVPRGLRT
jgi:hypothetical protein